MSYLVMARKWRPLTFEDVVNQEHVKVTLAHAIQSERIAHAYLFSGPRGVGKTTIARILAKALNCEQGPTPTPCNTCSVCSEITEGRSLDVLEIDGASNRGIDEVRNLRENIKYAPLKSTYKIYIIDEVHMLTDAAFNALLKTLEEPPKHVVFMFATTAPQKVPATILSRCQRFDFRRISAAEIQQRLARIAGQEEVPIDDEALMLLAKRADGSMRDGQSLLDQVASFSDERISAATVRHLLGLVDQELLFRLTDIITSKETAAGLDLANSVMAEGVDIQEFFKSLAEHLRNLLVTKAAGDSPGLVNIDETGRRRLQEQAATFSEEDLLRMISIVSEHELNLRRSSMPRLDLELALMRLIKMDSSVTIDEIFKRLEGVVSPSGGDFSILPREAKPEPSLFDNGPAYSPPRAAATAPPPPPPKISPAQEKKNPAPPDPSSPPPEPETRPDPSGGAAGLEDIMQHWNRVVNKVREKKMSVGTFLSGGRPSGFEQNNLTVTFPRGTGFGIDMINKNKKMISDIFQEEYGTPYTLTCVIDETLKPPSDTPAKKKVTTSKELDVEGLYKKEPIIKKIIDEFNGEIV